MAEPLYIRKEYFRGVVLTDKSAHILEFQYKKDHVYVFEKGDPVFVLQYYLETKYKAVILDMRVIDPLMRAKGYGGVCLREIMDQMKKKQVSIVHSLLTPPDGECSIMDVLLFSRFLQKNGFSIGGDGKIAVRILD